MFLRTLASTGLVILSIVAQAGVMAADAPSGHRAALLLGNSKYDDFTLPGVVKSLDEVNAALVKQGYQVERYENLKQQELRDAVEKFAKSVPTNGVALVYYDGLGAHVQRFENWYNFLRPVGEKMESDNDYRSRAFGVSDLIKSLDEQSGSRINLLFLDCSWASPIKPDKGVIHNGVRKYEVEPGTTLVTAAADSKTIEPTDGTSPLAKSLVQHLGDFDGSVEDGCAAISADLNNAWYGGTSKAGLGTRSTIPIATECREGKTPGEGFVNSIGMTFRWCPAGSFTMGSSKVDSASTRDREPVQVKLSKGFWIGEHEVTQREHYAVMRKNLPLTFTKHKNAPFWGAGDIKGVTDFCKKLSDIERKAGRLPNGWEYGCPTEAEWEYACRAGSKTAFCFGDSPSELGRYGNFADHALWLSNPNYYWSERGADDGIGEELAPVGSYQPNAWGIRDMHGNVAELVADHLLPKLPGGTDPLVKVEKNGVRQLRGGAWCSKALYCESSFRNAAPAKDKHNFVGFRIVLKKTK